LPKKKEYGINVDFQQIANSTHIDCPAKGKNKIKK